jgi:LDH2 family malate/lactate/ureidoglycolate dehydrogenase
VTTRVPYEILHDMARSLLVKAGLDEDGAAMAADVVCYADERGLATHGVNALVSMYVPWLRDGRVDAKAGLRTVGGEGVVTVLDGGNGLGPVVMTRAVDCAMDAARQHGAGIVAVRGSTHFGAAGFYTHRMARAGLIGIAMTNCGAQGVVPPLGGVKRLLGTNPLSAAVPAGTMPPFVLDMSTTAKAAGHIRAAWRDGRPVPEGWLIGKGGEDVTDPGAYYAGEADLAWLGGRLLTGGAKGYGLGLLVDLLCGPLTGASYGPHAGALDRAEPSVDHNVGHLAIAIAPAAFGDREAIERDVAVLLGTVCASPPVAGGDTVTYPGEPEARCAAEVAIGGVSLTATTVAAAVKLAIELDVPVPSALRTAGSGSSS